MAESRESARGPMFADGKFMHRGRRVDPKAITDTAILAIDKVRYYGEPVALVIASDPYLAADAVPLVDVEYDDLPAVQFQGFRDGRDDRAEVVGQHVRAAHEHRAAVGRHLLGVAAHQTGRHDQALEHQFGVGLVRFQLTSETLVIRLQPCQLCLLDQTVRHPWDTHPALATAERSLDSKHDWWQHTQEGTRSINAHSFTVVPARRAHTTTP